MRKIITILLAGIMISGTLQAQTQTTKKANAGANQGTIKDSTSLGTNYGNTTDAPGAPAKAMKTKKQMRQEKRAAKKAGK